MIDLIGGLDPLSHHANPETVGEIENGLDDARESPREPSWLTNERSIFSWS